MMASHTRNKRAVVAVGGNSLIKNKDHQSVSDQYAAVCETVEHVVDMIESGWDVVLTHGGGPQVGFILRRSELAENELHRVPLDYVLADLQGAAGYMLQRSLHNEFVRRGIEREAVTVVTQTAVDADDPAFRSPSKPIGSFMDEATAKAHAQNDGWTVMEDAGRGWRRVSPSPLPKRIIEANSMRTLLDQGFVVISTGGGGIPVVEREDGSLEGVEAVLDKDYGASLLATAVNADLFLISTAVEKVALNFNAPNQRWLDHMTLDEARRYMVEGHFASGSMRPKIQAIIWYLEREGQKALVTSPERIAESLAGRSGTWITA